MNAPAKSIYYFGFYLLLLGLVLIAFPNGLLSTFQIPETNEVWIRVLGAVVFNIGILYILMARSGHALFFTLTVYTRSVIFIWFLLFVVVGWAPTQLVLFGAVDLIGALWTYLAMKNAA
jgi:hypothetical protein